MITVISTGWAPGTKQQCIDSVASQVGVSHEHVVIDAALQDPPKEHFENLIEAVAALPDDRVVACVDLDDWLSDERALAKVAAMHANGALVTYGQFQFPDGRKGWATPYGPGEDVRQTWRATHLKTFRAGLFKRIRREDLMYCSAWAKHARDHFLMFPMLEMAGSRARFCPDVVYVYNADPGTYSEEDRREERQMVEYVRALPPYQPLSPDVVRGLLGTASSRMLVYTSICGGYDTVKSVPDGGGGYEWRLYSDSDKGGGGWNLVPSGVQAATPRMQAKWHKCHPPEDVKVSLWIDGSVEIHSVALIEAALAALEHSDWAMFRHADRGSILEEAEYSLTSLKYIGKPLREQVEHYMKNEPVSPGLWGGGVIARRHTPKVLAASAAWYEECVRWSDQDQISLPMILAKYDIAVGELTAGGNLSHNSLFTVVGRPGHFWGALGVPVLSRYDLLDRLIASAEAGVVNPHRYFIVDNGGRLDVRSPSIQQAVARGAVVSVLSPGCNLGVAASWNAILRAAHPRYATVISNDDITLGPRTLEYLYSKDAIDRHDFVIAEGPPQANGWCLFTQAPSCAAKIGYYDKNFFPAYYEDTDYHRRMTLAGIEPFRLPTDHAHEGWATIKQEGHDGPTYRGQQRNLDYYARKWGGAPGQEQFAEPFDGRETPPPAPPREDVWVDVALGAVAGPPATVTRAPAPPLMRYDVVNRLLEKLGAERYLEIGVSNGETMRRVKAPFRVGVDPLPQSDGMLAATEFFPVDSDAFFARGDAVGKFGVTFIDGLHHADQAYRDIENACRVSEIVVVHDANPMTEALQIVPSRGGDWTGDVWKSVARVRAEGRHTVRTVDADYGIAMILPGRAESIPVLPRETWNDLVQHREELLGLLRSDEWEEWFDARDDGDAMVLNRFQRRAQKAMEGKSKRICLNMIVKNEGARIERCLAAAAPFVDCWAIADTGSTDDTPALIERFFAERGCPGRLLKTTFKNFSQARNEALALARTVPGWQYVLLIDADMVLTGTLDTATLSAPAYQLLQRDGGGLNWWNARLLRRDVPANYVGVTHEYLSVDNPQNLNGLVIDDHCDGANRGEKAERDIRLLNQGLADEPQNVRYMFYLAQTYRETGRYHEAIQWYRRRIEIGGWDEEIWASYYGIAHSYKAIGDEPQMTKACLEAYNFRPNRGESLKLLAQTLRERSQNDSAVLVAEELAKIPLPGDLLFVEGGVYEWGADQEIAIAGYYSKRPGRREAAYRACARLTTIANNGIRKQARENFVHYARSATELFGATVKPIDWKPADGYAPMNPSVCVGPDGRRIVLVRTVNYTVTTEGQYPTLDGSGIIRTHNHVLEMDADWKPVRSTEIQNAPELPARKLGFVEGYEDCRLWHDGASFLASCTVRDAPDSDGRCEMAILSLDAAWRVQHVEAIRDYDGDKTQKNWMPVVGRPGSFVYLCDPTVVIERRPASTVEVCRSAPPACLVDLRGGSQVIAHGGGWLCITHEVTWCPHRVYLHRFVRLDVDFKVTAVSDPFYFVAKGIEFCAGLARDNDKLVASFGVNDASAYLAIFDPAAVDRVLRPL
jgi:glycosyltransferase involved in cell wall biosynthesis